MESLPEHGSYARYQLHYKAGEEPCELCAQARSDYAMWHRFRRGDQRMPRQCRRCGSVFSGHRCGGLLQ